MAYTEYFDLYEKAQKKGHGMLLCLVDVKNSRTDNNYPLLRMKYIEAINKIAEKMNCIDISKRTNLAIGKNIFVLGDAVGFVVETERKKDVDKDIIRLLKELDINLTFHYDSSFFDTFDYVKGNEKYYFGYAIQQTESNAKKSNV